MTLNQCPEFNKIKFLKGVSVQLPSPILKSVILVWPYVKMRSVIKWDWMLMWINLKNKISICLHESIFHFPVMLTLPPTVALKCDYPASV
ncbi:MAG: hypothetical protein BGO25_05405 [Acidobacteriales bacterium 59-55]|nr:MAG: hypothetical protein BGO25_05405 [Acidobacteriales bacterium 59-55]